MNIYIHSYDNPDIDIPYIPPGRPSNPDNPDNPDNPYYDTPGTRCMSCLTSSNAWRRSLYRNRFESSCYPVCIFIYLFYLYYFKTKRVIYISISIYNYLAYICLIIYLIYKTNYINVYIYIYI